MSWDVPRTRKGRNAALSKICIGQFDLRMWSAPDSEGDVPNRGVDFRLFYEQHGFQVMDGIVCSRELEPMEASLLCSLDIDYLVIDKYGTLRRQRTVRNHFFEEPRVWLSDARMTGREDLVEDCLGELTCAHQASNLLQCLRFLPEFDDLFGIVGVSHSDFCFALAGAEQLREEI